MISGVDNYGILALATGFNGVEYATDLAVQLSYQPIILAKLIAYIAPLPWV